MRYVLLFIFVSIPTFLGLVGAGYLWRRLRPRLRWPRRWWLAAPTIALVVFGFTAGWLTNDWQDRRDADQGFGDVEHDRLVEACTDVLGASALCLQIVDRAQAEGRSYDDLLDLLVELERDTLEGGA